MAGILDNKTRILDTVLTSEGRRQLAQGRLRVTFGSFTDGGTFYEADSVSGSSDASSRLFLEAPSSLPRDQITFETDDAGRLVSFYGAGDNIFLTDRSLVVSSSLHGRSNSTFASLASELLSSSVDNFKNLQLLGTRDIFLESDGFDISHENLNFTVTRTFPFDMERESVKGVLEHMPSFFQDARLTHIPNFKYLPPVNKGTSDPIGSFPSKGQKEITWNDLETKLVEREFATVTFPETSQENNLYTQMFELANGRMTKLDVIDYGEFVTDDPTNPIKQVYFVGKVYIDSTGNGTFVNQFTLIFD